MSDDRRYDGDSQCLPAHRHVWFCAMIAAQRGVSDEESEALGAWLAEREGVSISDWPGWRDVIDYLCPPDDPAPLVTFRRGLMDSGWALGAFTDAILGAVEQPGRVFTVPIDVLPTAPDDEHPYPTDSEGMFAADEAEAAKRATGRWRIHVHAERDPQADES